MDTPDIQTLTIRDLPRIHSLVLNRYQAEVAPCFDAQGQASFEQFIEVDAMQQRLMGGLPQIHCSI